METIKNAVDYLFRMIFTLIRWIFALPSADEVMAAAISMAASAASGDTAKWVVREGKELFEWKSWNFHNRRRYRLRIIDLRYEYSNPAGDCGAISKGQSMENEEPNGGSISRGGSITPITITFFDRFGRVIVTSQGMDAIAMRQIEPGRCILTTPSLMPHRACTAAIRCENGFTVTAFRTRFMMTPGFFRRHARRIGCNGSIPSPNHETVAGIAFYDRYPELVP